MTDLQRAIRQPLQSGASALSFLTVFPVPGQIGRAQGFFGAALFYFTPVGFLLGCVAALSAMILQSVGAELLTAALLAVILSALSGFLHLDGLADTADGFLSSKDRDTSLEIMRDSRIGVMGAVALVSVLMIKAAAIHAIHPAELTGALICAAAAGRTAMVVMMYFMPYARSSGGLGQLFYQEENRHLAPLLSTLLLLVLVIILMPARMLTLICVYLLVQIGFSVWCKKKIAGFTGDTLGCLCELMETGILLGAGLTL